MSKILGYGEDALTLWALKNHTSEILTALKDETVPSDCLIFFRPSFGRRGGSETPQFGEFDAIIATPQNVYLIESKWDNFKKWDNGIVYLDEVQKLRHQVLKWYLTHWETKYSGHWRDFILNHSIDFQNKFGKKPVEANKLLAKNLESVLLKIYEHCHLLKPENIKNVLMFFYNEKIESTPPTRVTENYNLVCLDYSHALEGHFVVFEK